MESALYHISTTIPDSLEIAGKFLQKRAVQLHPHLIQPSQDHVIFYVLFGLLTIFAFIRFFYPSALRAILSLFSGTGSRRVADNYNKSGLVVPLFLIINFFVSMTISILVALVRIGVFPSEVFSLPQFWVAVAGAVILFYLFNQLLTFLAGFIFNTMEQASIQIKNTAFWAYFSGMLLTPLLLIYFYSKNSLILDFIMVTMVVILMFKWFQTIRVGLTTRNYHLLHLFLYLCAVEIVPLFLLVKVSIL